jgi:hypothetical protein
MVSPEAPEYVTVERVYELNFDAFTKAHWNELDRIERSLPGRYRINQVPMWFGSDELSPPYLLASVEPPGLQVYGVLSLHDWKEWDAAFQRALVAADLPFREED